MNFIFACTTCALSAILTYESCYICMLRFRPLNKFLFFFFPFPDIQLSLYFLAHCCIATLWNSNRIYPQNQFSFYCSSGCHKGLWSFLFLCGCCSLLGGIQHKCGTSEVCNGDLNKKLPSDLCYLKSFTSTDFISSVEKFLASCLVLFCCELLGFPPPEGKIGCVASENNISE